MNKSIIIFREFKNGDISSDVRLNHFKKEIEEKFGKLKNTKAEYDIVGNTLIIKITKK
jgi:hypothetical protein